jgi:hypothetical protein
MDGVANHQKRLEGYHHFVVFDVITNEHENGFLGHVTSTGIVTEEVALKRWKKSSESVCWWQSQSWSWPRVARS